MSEGFAKFEPPMPLTDREKQILDEVGSGRSLREVSRALHVSENTVKNHVRNIIEKLRLYSGGSDL